MEPRVSKLWRFEGRSQISLFYRTNILSSNFIPYCSQIVLKCFRILTHCCAAVLSINTLFYKTNNIFYSLENWIWDKTNNDSESTSKIKVRSVGKFWKCCLHQQLFAFKKFCTETRLLNISKTTNVTDFINTIY